MSCQDEPAGPDAIERTLQSLSRNVDTLMEILPRVDRRLAELDPTWQPRPVDEPLAGLWRLVLDLTEQVAALTPLERLEVLTLMDDGILLPEAVRRALSRR